MHNVLVTIPSARGVHPQTLSCVFDLRTELEKRGHRLHLGHVYRMPLDLARNELVTAFLSTACDLNLWLDDDCQIEPAHVEYLFDAIEGGCDIVSAPCRMRGENNLFNIVPIGEVSSMGRARVVECAWTGFGAVMVRRAVWEKMHAGAVERDKMRNRSEPECYLSTLMPPRISAGFFKSMVVPARRFDLGAPEDMNIYLLDDRAFSARAHDAGFKIHAAIDVATAHDGMRGCFAEELERFDRARAVEHTRARIKALVDINGKPIDRGAL